MSFKNESQDFICRRENAFMSLAIQRALRSIPLQTQLSHQEVFLLKLIRIVRFTSCNLQVDGIIGIMDVNRDGVVTSQELCAWLLS